MEKETTNPVFKMVNPSGFKELFYCLIKETGCTHAEAFHQLNNQYHQFTGKYRYASFESFKVVKDRK